MENDLTKRIIKYKADGMGLKEIIDSISLLAYNYPQKKYGKKDEDDSGDFFCFFYPNISKMITRYVYKGKPFEAYLLTALKWQYKSYIAKKNSEKLKYKLLSNQEFWHLNEEPELLNCISKTAVSETARKVLKIKDNGRIENRTTINRILIFAFKSAAQIDNRLIEHVAILTGNKKEWIFYCIEKLKEHIKHRLDKINSLKEKRNRSFYNLFFYQARYKDESDQAARALLYEKIIIEKKRLRQMNNKLSGISSTPSNKEIAKILDIPGGTVDSGIHYFKSTLSRLFK